MAFFDDAPDEKLVELLPRSAELEERSRQVQRAADNLGARIKLLLARQAENTSPTFSASSMNFATTF